MLNHATRSISLVRCLSCFLSSCLDLVCYDTAGPKSREGRQGKFPCLSLLPCACPAYICVWGCLEDSWTGARLVTPSLGCSIGFHPEHRGSTERPKLVDSGPHAHSEPPLPFPLLGVVCNLKKGCSKIRPSAPAICLCSFSEAFSEPSLTFSESGSCHHVLQNCCKVWVLHGYGATFGKLQLVQWRARDLYFSSSFLCFLAFPHW